MNLTQRKFAPGSRTYRDVMRLYRTAFPPEQRFCPLAVWGAAAVKSRVDFLAYYDGDTFCGMTYTVDTGKYLYLYYIAVDPALRSRGCGAAMLDLLKQQHADRAIVLDVEAPEENSPNREQREKRIAFYVRNGFYRLDHHVITEGKRLDILSTSRDFDADEYWKGFRIMSQTTLARLKKVQKLLHLWRD